MFEIIANRKEMFRWARQSGLPVAWVRLLMNFRTLDSDFRNPNPKEFLRSWKWRFKGDAKHFVPETSCSRCFLSLYLSNSFRQTHARISFTSTILPPANAWQQNEIHTENSSCSSFCFPFFSEWLWMLTELSSGGRFFYRKADFKLHRTLFTSPPSFFSLKDRKPKAPLREGGNERGGRKILRGRESSPIFFPAHTHAEYSWGSQIGREIHPICHPSARIMKSWAGLFCLRS